MPVKGPIPTTPSTREVELQDRILGLVDAIDHTVSYLEIGLEDGRTAEDRRRIIAEGIQYLRDGLREAELNAAASIARGTK